MTGWISAILILTGTVFSFLAAVGILRMPDFYSRLQTSTKASTLGVGCVVAAAALELSGAGAATRALLVVAFLVLTSPIAAHMISRAAYAEGVPFWKGILVDELKTDQGRTADASADSGRAPAEDSPPAD